MGRGCQNTCTACFLGSSVEAPNLGNLQRALESAHDRASTKHSAKRAFLAPLLLSPPSLLKITSFFLSGRAGSSLLPWLSLVGESRGPSRCSAWASPCEGLSVAGHRLGRAGFSSLGAQWLQLPGSALLTHKLSCSAANGTLPDQGLNPYLLHGRWILSTAPPRKASLHLM